MNVRRLSNRGLAEKVREIAMLAGLTEVRLSLVDGEVLEEAARRLRMFGQEDDQ